MQWFRLHDEVLDDRKVQQLSPALFKHWINLLCLASKSNPRGTLPDVETIAFRLRLSDAKAREVVTALTDAGLMEVNEDGYIQPHNWKSRQYGKPSDEPERVAERVKKHRDQQRNADVTPPKRDETPLYTDTETESDTEQKQSREETPPQPPSPGGDVPVQTKRTRRKPDLDGFQDWYDIYPRHTARADAEQSWSRMSPEERASALNAIRAQVSWPCFADAPPDKQPYPATWLNRRRWEDEPPKDLIDQDAIFEAWKHGAAAPPPQLFGRRAS